MPKTLAEQFTPFGSRGGLTTPMGRDAIDADRHAAMLERDPAPRDPGGPDPGPLADFMIRLDQATGNRTILGRRRDQPGGIGPRFQAGLLDASYSGGDGFYGIYRWDADGVRQIPMWVNA